ncbi:MAG: homocysteine S-methyltransferase family protein [Anaerolineae bacterium]
MALTSRYLEQLAKGALVFDGAMGTSLQMQNLTAEDFGGEATWGCNDYLVISKPEAVETVHRSFLAVGCNVLETDTFRSNRITLKEYGLQDRVIEINRTAAQLAKRLAQEYDTPDRPRFVAGSIGPSGLLPSSTDPVLSNITFGELVEVFREQAAGLLDGGVDVLLIETSQDILEVKAAILGIQAAFAETGRRVPLQCQVTLDTSGRMLLGTDIAAALTTLQALPIDIIGLNCSTGPDFMREPIRYLTENARLPVSCIPNAGLPINTGIGEAVYPLEPGPMGETLGDFVHRLGVRVVGGCCGTTPAHLTHVVEAVSSAPPDAVSFRFAPVERDGWTHLERPDAPDLAMVSSAIRATSLTQDPPPMLIGERVNAQGSRKVKRLLLEDRYEDIVTVAREQVEGGAHTLDVQVALTERADEAAQMHRLVHLLSTAIEAPLVIDTTETDVVKAALEASPGRAIVNSINLERGRERIDAYLPLIKAHGAAVIALTIDERGMAHEVERKVEVAKRIYDIVVGEYGLPSHDLIFDPQVFPVTTGQIELRDDAKWTIEGIRRIKAECPGALTSIGVSNVSFGIAPPARAVLNSVMLYHCVEAGLDMAIVNPAHITPYAEIDAEQRELAEDLLLNRREDALARYIQYWQGREGTVEETAKEDPTAGMTVEQRLHWQIVHRKKDGIEELVDQVVANASADRPTSEGAVEALNTVLLPAMKEVGDKFGAGELILPFVLQSAEVMKRAVARLETYLDRLEGTTKGTLVLATVFGDVHDIGKNLVNTILTNNGYTVHDLGKQVPINTIIEKAIEVNADAIGLSALLVSTSKQMPLAVQELHRRGLNIPVIIGGAAINRRFGRRALFVDDQQTPYPAGVFYCKDAFEGLETMDRLQDPAQRQAFIDRLIEEAKSDVYLSQAAEARPAETDVEFKPLAPAPDIPTPPFWGWRVLDDIPLDDVLACLDTRELFRLAWGARGTQGAEFERLVEREFQPRLARLEEQARAEGWLRPRAIYGYFPAQSDGDTLVVYDPASVPFPTRNRYADRSQVIRAGEQRQVVQVRAGEAVARDESLAPGVAVAQRAPALSGEVAPSAGPREVARFAFPRQKSRGRLCLADYFAPLSSGRFDVAVFQVVTVGDEADNLSERLMAEGDYSEGYYIHGFSVEAAEATAEYLHRYIRQELGLAPGRGKRYSWGYPACPDLSDHETVFRLLPVQDALGVDLTEAYQLVPEQSTAAMVVHHPEAIYFGAL